MRVPNDIVRMDAEFRIEKSSGLFCVRIKLQPLLIYGLGHAIRCDARRLEPVSDSIDTMLRWSKEIVYFFSSVVLPIPRRCVIRARF